jgi:hypothetical protein
MTYGPNPAIHMTRTETKEVTMTKWSEDELRKIAEADDLHISPFREDGVT